ncbi:MAG TPA: hypothetical protein IAC02_02475 [Candidatus Coprovivens excrementavium]|nr:hypothetical protein [Candidatus Coprovivens excrementavium]
MLEMMKLVDHTELLEILFTQAEGMLENDFQDNGIKYNAQDVSEMVYNKLLNQKGQKYITCFNDEHYIRAERDLYNKYMENGKMLKLIKIHEKYLNL